MRKLRGFDCHGLPRYVAVLKLRGKLPALVARKLRGKLPAVVGRRGGGVAYKSTADNTVCMNARFGGELCPNTIAEAMPNYRLLNYTIGYVRTYGTLSGGKARTSDARHCRDASPVAALAGFHI